MTVENRKLFANRDARRRLSEMGGIMASSPELLGEAQMYADGGQVSLGQQIGQGMRNFFQPIGQGMRETMQPMGQQIREGLSSSYSIGPVEAMMNALNTPRPAPAGAMEDMAASGMPLTYAEFLERRRQGLPITEQDLVLSADNLTQQQAADVMAMIEDPGYLPGPADIAAAEAPGMAPMETPPMNPDMPLTKAAQTIGDYAAGITRTRTPEEQAAIDAEREAKRKEFQEATAPAPEEAAMSEAAGAAISNKMDADAAANQTDLLSILEATANDPEKTPAEKAGDASITTLSGLGVTNAAEMTTKDRVKAYEEMFKEMLGEKDEDVAKEMWHNMAMIGFAIAAGESPNALQNIASGLLAGTKMMREDRATRQAREDKIRMMAISEGLSDERAAQKIASAERIAALRGTGSRKTVSVPTNPLTEILKIDQVFRENLGRPPTEQERIAEENRILLLYDIDQIQEGAPQLLDRWKSVAGPETGAIEDGMRYIGPSYNRTAAQDEKNWVKVE